MLVLESYESAKKRKATIYAELRGYGTSNDAFHATKPPEDGRGARLAMVNALVDSGLAATNIAHVNLHATRNAYRRRSRVQSYPLALWRRTFEKGKRAHLRHKVEHWSLSRCEWCNRSHFHNFGVKKWHSSRHGWFIATVVGHFARLRVGRASRLFPSRRRRRDTRK